MTHPVPVSSRRQRMTLAADLLHDTIARQVGYQDALAFSVAFERALGRSPSAWRRTLRAPE